jgi:hypothetical protein
MAKQQQQQYVIVRSHLSGVWAGELESRAGEEVVLLRARRLWSWTGAASCSGLAVRGPSGGRICEPVERAVVRSVVEVLAATEVAKAAIAKVQPWV